MPGPISDWPCLQSDLNLSLYNESYVPHPSKQPELGVATVDLLLKKKEEQKKMKNSKLKTEVQAAVREYLNDLIQERNQPGKGGMAVTTHDLLVAAKQAGQKLHRGDANGFMMSYVQKTRPDYTCVNSTAQQQQQQPTLVAPKLPNAGNHGNPSNELITNGLELLETSRSKEGPIKSHSFRPKENGYGGNNSKKKNIYDYHWLVWKTGRTPTPAPPCVPYNMTPAPPTPRPPTRGYTPAIEEDVALPDHLCEPNRPPSEAGWNKPQVIRSPSPMMYRNATPAEMKPDHRNNMTTPQAILTDNADYQTTNTAYKPALQNWINAASDYEKDVAYNLFQALNHGSYAGPPNRRGRPKTATGAGMYKPVAPPRYHTRPITAGIRTSLPQYKTIHNPYQDDQYLNIVAKSVGSQNPTQFKYTKSRPRATHIPRPPQTEDLNNTGSFFMNAKLPYKSSYTIHPDWASEQKNVGKNLKHMTSTKGKAGLKYGWK